MWHYNYNNELYHSNHKYIDKYKSKLGNWVYVYKNKIKTAGSKVSSAAKEISSKNKEIQKNLKSFKQAKNRERRYDFLSDEAWIRREKIGTVSDKDIERSKEYEQHMNKLASDAQKRAEKYYDDTGAAIDSWVTETSIGKKMYNLSPNLVSIGATMVYDTLIDIAGLGLNRLRIKYGKYM